ncbi:MAG: U32 family peptidase [Bryobacteraceae bacterium]
MSPAGHWPQLRAAVEAGADAVYFGLHHFSARAKVGFALPELPEALAALHERGVRGYVTFNTLVFEHELDEAARTIAAVAEAGADALIVQDAAVLRLARSIAPSLELHASTQMSITDSAGVRFARSLGVERVTLARELSLAEVRRIIDETGCDIEIFVHGALCVAYSGQCFSSEAWGGRSANRGQCAQACRLPYELTVDGRVHPLGDARYLLSPGDLYALEQVPEIVAAGVAALKIEGRYKDAGYVAIATDAYRRAVDRAAAATPPDPDEQTQDRRRLEQIYSRGLGAHFLAGTDHQRVVVGRAPRHRGVLLGRVTRVAESAVWVAVDGARPAPGDGVVFDSASWRSPEEVEEGGRVFEVLPALDETLELRFANGAIDFTRIRPADRLWRTHDPAVERAARRFLDPPAPVAKIPVDVHAEARAGEPLRSVWRLAGSRPLEIIVESDAPVQPAANRALNDASLREQFERLGATPFTLRSVRLETAGPVFVAASALNRIRREAAGKLQTALRRPPSISVRPADVEPETPLEDAAPGEPRIHLLVRNGAQLDAALDPAMAAIPASITLDYLDLYGLRPSVERVKAAGLPVRVATPRVLKPGESRIVDFLLSLDCPMLVRAAGMLERLRESPHALTGDFSLNAANTRSARIYLTRGLARLTPTHDLNAAQVAALARGIGGSRIEAVVYQHLPVFHTEHCVFCRFLSSGTSYRDCGRPCEKHTVALADRDGRAHPVVADVGCRNTVFGAEAQHAARHLDAWLGVGIRDFRLEFVHETEEQLRAVALRFARTLRGEITAAALGAEWARVAPGGVTEGSLFVPKDYLTLPVLQ